MEIEIPFMESFKDMMLTDKKVCTSRNKIYGDPGDTFKIFGAKFKLICVAELPLDIVAEYFYTQEGCETPDNFRIVWVDLHPRKGWDPDQRVFTHFFTRV